MRLWHKDLIPYLPRQQLIAQWRECCAICSNIANKGTPNHLLVNKIINYPLVHFLEYTRLVTLELGKRNYKISETSRKNFINNFNRFFNYNFTINWIGDWIFNRWHNKRYLLQCLANLSEKYDCGGIPENEWGKIKSAFPEQIKLIYNGVGK